MCPVLQGHCVSCYTKTWCVLFYKDIVCPVLQGHGVSCFTRTWCGLFIGELYVLFNKDIMCPAFQGYCVSNILGIDIVAYGLDNCIILRVVSFSENICNKAYTHFIQIKCGVIRTYNSW